MDDQSECFFTGFRMDDQSECFLNEVWDWMANCYTSCILFQNKWPIRMLLTSRNRTTNLPVFVLHLISE
jgi:hypothetical protein